jgi:hypothetical protein
MAEQASVLPLLNNFELQGGTIAFSEEGKGSSFGFIMNFKKSNPRNHKRRNQKHPTLIFPKNQQPKEQKYWSKM